MPTSWSRGQHAGNKADFLQSALNEHITKVDIQMHYANHAALAPSVIACPLNPIYYPM